MKRLFTLVGIAMLLLNIQAQDANKDLLKKLVEKNILTNEEAQENESKEDVASSPVKKIREAFNTPYMKWGGYGLLLYRYNDKTELKHSVEPRVIFLSMTGQFNKFKYFILGEAVNPLIYEFNGEWAASDALKVKGGLMKTPFSMENQISLTDLETISNTRTISSLVGMSDDVQQLQNGRNNTGRDIGIQVHGNLLNKNGHEWIQYAAGFFQGSGIGNGDRDNNKDFTGMLLLKPHPAFRIGGGAYFGEATYNNNHHVRNRWIASTDYKSDNLYIRAEWLAGNDGGIQKEGIYATAQYYLIPQKLNVVAKVDYFNRDKDNSSEVTDYTAGVNYYFFPGCRFQLNYTFSDYSKNWITQAGKNSVSAQMQIVF